MSAREGSRQPSTSGHRPPEMFLETEGVCPPHGGDGHEPRAARRRPARTALSAQRFVTKTSATRVPQPPSHPVSPFSVVLGDFSVVCFLGEKTPQRETCCRRGRGDRNGRSAKRPQHQRVARCLGPRKGVSAGALHRTERALEVPEVSRCQNTHPIFYKYIPGFGAPMSPCSPDRSPQLQTPGRPPCPVSPRVWRAHTWQLYHVRTGTILS